MSRNNRRSPPIPQPRPKAKLQGNVGTDQTTTQSLRLNSSTESRFSDYEEQELNVGTPLRRPTPPRIWSLKDIWELLGIIALVAAVIVFGLSLSGGLEKVEEKVNGVSNAVEKIHDSTSKTAIRVENIQSDLVELKSRQQLENYRSTTKQNGK